MHFFGSFATSSLSPFLSYFYSKKKCMFCNRRLPKDLPISLAKLACYTQKSHAKRDRRFDERIHGDNSSSSKERDDAWSPEAAAKIQLEISIREKSFDVRTSDSRRRTAFVLLSKL